MGRLWFKSTMLSPRIIRKIYRGDRLLTARIFQSNLIRDTKLTYYYYREVLMVD